MRVMLMLLLVACRLNFDEVPADGGAQHVANAVPCDSALCACPPATSCAYACTSNLACSVDCTEAAFCEVDCGPAEYCVVECPRGGCQVTGCGPGCTVLCAEIPASRNGLTASCP